MKTLVTGATGFVGRALCPALVRRGDEVIALGSKDCDLTDRSSLERFNSVRFDRIFHLAAWTRAGDFCLHHQGQQWVINQLINTHVVEWWQKRQPQALLVAIGTSCAYDPRLEPKEENYLAGTPTESLLTYALTKRMLYAGLTAVHAQYKLNYLYLVPDTLYGPGYHADGRQQHFIFDLIAKINAGVTQGVPVVLWGDGRQRRELVYIDDFVSMALALSDRVTNDIVNVAPGKALSIRSYAGMISAKTGYDARKIRYDTSQYVGARCKYLVGRKLWRLLPEAKFTPLETGIDKTIRWFKEQK